MLREYRSARFGLLFCVGGYYAYAFAPAGWVMYAGMVLASLGGLVGPSLSAIMSRQAGPTGQGELQGALGAVVSLTGIASPLAMTQLFGYFSSDGAVIHLPGAPFFASATLMLGALLLLQRQRSSMGSAAA